MTDAPKRDHSLTAEALTGEIASGHAAGHATQAQLDKTARGVDSIVLTRAGHLCNSLDAHATPTCEAAIVVYVHTPTLVNLDVTDHNGVHSAITSVTVGPPVPGTTFHLSRDCPWHR